MIVIVEGLDGVGKTTICELIAQKRNYKYIKESYTNNCEEKEFRMINMLSRLTESKTFLYDRATLIDDFVYSFLNKSASSLIDYFDIIIEILKKCKIIHLELDDEIRRKRFESRGDKFVNNDDMKIIVKQYTKIYSYLDNVNYVTLDGDLKKDVEKVLEVIDED